MNEPGAGELGTVAVFAPMPSELKPVVRAFGLEPETIGGLELHAGNFGGFRVIASPTGMGTRLATEAAKRVLDAAEIDHVLVVGIAGGVTSQIGDVVVPEVVIHGVTGAEFRPAPWGENAQAGRLRTSDEFIVDHSRLEGLARDGVVAVDMETAAVAAECEQRSVPWSTFRVISDMANESEEAIIGLARPDGSPNMGAALKFMARKPWRIRYLVRLAREATAAARTAARVAAEASAAGIAAPVVAGGVAAVLIETTTFRLLPSTDDATFLAADRRVQDEVVPNLAGFYRRTTARSPGGEWIVIVLWGSEVEADAVAAQVAAHPATGEFDALIDAATRSESRYLTLD